MLFYFFYEDLGAVLVPSAARVHSNARTYPGGISGLMGSTGEELLITARTASGAAEVARHRLSTPGSPSILDEHYPHHPYGNGPPAQAKATHGSYPVVRSASFAACRPLVMSRRSTGDSTGTDAHSANAQPVTNAMGMDIRNVTMRAR
jgi:hypothetical protein